jgi:hypothetical protein
VLRNPAGACEVDPDGGAAEADETDNDCPLDRVDVAAGCRSIYLPLVVRR